MDCPCFCHHLKEFFQLQNICNVQFVINPFNITISYNYVPTFCCKYVLLITYNHDNTLKKLLCVHRVYSLAFAYTLYIRHDHECLV